MLRKNTTYRITTNPKDLTYTYCSEIVWQSYYYGAGKSFKTLYQSPSQSYYKEPSIIHPYDYLTYQSYNGFSTVKSVN